MFVYDKSSLMRAFEEIKMIWKTQESELDEAERAMKASLEAEMKIQRKQIEERFSKPLEQIVSEVKARSLQNKAGVMTETGNGECRIER